MYGCKGQNNFDSKNTSGYVYVNPEKAPTSDDPDFITDDIKLFPDGVNFDDSGSITDDDSR